MAKKTRSYKTGQLERLKDPAYATEYINAAMEAGDNTAFLLALRNVAEAQTMNAVATQAGLRRRPAPGPESNRHTSQPCDRGKSMRRTQHGLALNMLSRPR